MELLNQFLWQLPPLWLLVKLILAQLAGNQTDLHTALDAKSALLQSTPSVDLNEAQFRFALNEDAMATEKLAEGIRAFCKDAMLLDELLKA